MGKVKEKILIQIQHLLKLNKMVWTYVRIWIYIQIQHLLKLNLDTFSLLQSMNPNSNTTLVKVKSGLAFIPLSTILIQIQHLLKLNLILFTQ